MEKEESSVKTLGSQPGSFSGCTFLGFPLWGHAQLQLPALSTGSRRLLALRASHGHPTRGHRAPGQPRSVTALAGSQPSLVVGPAAELLALLKPRTEGLHFIARIYIFKGQFDSVIVDLRVFCSLPQLSLSVRRALWCHLFHMPYILMHQSVLICRPSPHPP